LGGCHHHLDRDDGEGFGRLGDAGEGERGGGDDGVHHR
jgi:hypothetical protein